MSELTGYWIIGTAKDRVEQAIVQAFAQSCPSRALPLKRMHKDDFIIFYSGKQPLGKPQVCQQFAGMGRVVDDEIVEVRVSQDCCPAKRTIAIWPSIKPLLADLNFIADQKNWGYPFRQALLEMNQHDFALIASQTLPKGNGPTN